MIEYPHFALPNLYLANGFKEFHTDIGVEREYEREDEIEQCVRQVLLRKPRRLRGWDLRFLRGGLGFSQADVGRLVDRDAQTVARWEKSARDVPAFVDLAVRLHFAKRFEPEMSVSELASYVDGTAIALPEKIVLTLTAAGWSFELARKVIYTAKSEVWGEFAIPVQAEYVIHPSGLRVTSEGTVLGAAAVDESGSELEEQELPMRITRPRAAYLTKISLQ